MPAYPGCPGKEAIRRVSVCRNRMRQYPALVNCTTIDWFSEWPADALLEVADKYLEHTDMANEEEVSAACALFYLLVYVSSVDLVII